MPWASQIAPDLNNDNDKSLDFQTIGSIVVHVTAAL